MFFERRLPTRVRTSLFPVTFRAIPAQPSATQTQSNLPPAGIVTPVQTVRGLNENGLSAAAPSPDWRAAASREGIVHDPANALRLARTPDTAGLAARFPKLMNRQRSAVGIGFKSSLVDRGVLMFSKRFIIVLLTLALGGTLEIARAQRPEPAVRVRALNEELVRVHSLVLRATTDQALGLRRQAAPLFEERLALLSALIAENPRQALTLAFPADLQAQLRRGFPDSASRIESLGPWEGQIEHMIIDGAPRGSPRTATHMKLGQSAVEIFFDGPAPADLKSGVTLRVTGMRAGTRVAASGGTLTGATATTDVNCGTTGPQKTAVLLVTFPGVPAPSISPSAVYNSFFGTSGRSVSGFLQEASHGQTSATGNVFGWYTLDAMYTCDQYYLMRQAAIRAADSDVNFLDYNRVVIVFPNPGGCTWSGLGTLGCGSMSSADGSFMASSAWGLSSYAATTDQTISVFAHELGHNLGLQHGRSRDFGAEALGPVGTTGTLFEYGDQFSVMGSSLLGLYSSNQRAALGWLTNGTNYQTVLGSGSFTLQPIEATPPGLQALKVQRGTATNSWVWIEYRQPLGNYDATLNSQVFAGALMHYQDPITGDIYSDLLDLTSATSSFADPALVSGNTWTDPYTNLSISVGAPTASGLPVTVNYGTATCTAASPIVTVSPTSASVAAGSSASFTVTVTNSDSTGCTTGTLSLSPAVPAGWTGTLAATSLSVSPGQSGSTTLTVTSLASATVGAYNASVTANKGTFTGTGTATINVTLVCTAANPTVSLSPASASIAAGASFGYTLQVVNNDSAACSSGSFSLSRTVPAGWSATFAATALTVAPGQSASTSLTVTPPSATASGTYPVSAVATKGSASGSRSAALTVNDACVTSIPAVVVSPPNPSVVAGGGASYTVTVTNKDSTACAGSAFALSSTQPAGWGAAFASPSLTIGPGTSASTTLTETTPASTAPGTYGIQTAAARGGGNIGSGPASLTVTSPLTVSLQVPAGPYSFGSTVSITATALTGAAAAGGSVQFILRKSDGNTVTKTVKTNSTGLAAWAYRVAQKDPKGNYIVNASATYGTRTALATPAAFTVQ